jgi:precorrin-6Y C5,15-methyltransferase (decarboxylating)
VPDIAVVQAAAPAALAGLPVPDAIFVGGGASDPGVLDAVLAALRSGGRLVVNAATLESEALLLARYADLGGELIRIAIARADPIGSMTAWRPAMPVTQWRWVKP